MRVASDCSAARTPRLTTMTTSADRPVSGRKTASKTTPISGATTRSTMGMANHAEMPQESWTCQYV